jgi:Cys-rich protein (TIGR01571 family)
MGYQCGFLPHGRKSFNGNACLLAAFCPWIAAADLRGRVRAVYGIEGNCCCDNIAAWCCTNCSVAQNYREVALRASLK